MKNLSLGHMWQARTQSAIAGRYINVCPTLASSTPAFYGKNEDPTEA